MKKKLLRQLLAAAALLVCSAATAGAQDAKHQYTDAIEFARSLIEAVMVESGTPGMSVAVGIDGAVVWSEGFGYADLEHRVPVWEGTRFRIGSVSKPVTAAAVGLLLERGQLDLDAPVQRYVPTFPEKRWPITTRQVAGHLAGIRHYAGDEFLSARHYETVLEGLEIFQDDTLLFEPGTRFSYSSYGWNLVSAVVEGASSVEFLDFMQVEVFDRLGLRHTVADQNRDIVPQRTRFYERTRDGRIVNAPYVDNSYKWAGGGFLSTPEDLVRFGFAFLGDEFLTPAVIEELWTPQHTFDGESTGYGIGWGVRIQDGRAVEASHGGGSVGGTTSFSIDVENEAVVAIVGNMSGAPTGGALPRLIRQAFLEPAELLASDGSGPDITGKLECTGSFRGEEIGRGTFELGGSPAEYWGMITWDNGTRDRIIHSASRADGTLLISVDGPGSLTVSSFTGFEDDELTGEWRSGTRSGPLVCQRD
ncbi:MAG: beta-lactamase family protein [Gemmatimonadetes bacterium]|uniref:Beta-lactamase family protein n=1 Tax=Candidatus Kutchimonas denitrificans TaxID=3056748 RepID=A0AAE4Z918_9BACT|nr:beta-lactamase family protein [Gemmatimonadota bacterium]NIR75893.1 beta-lactamase family protein [Candidatus Kutchimonas denitrificans]NIS02054.1 beta-lactamase family protein [Gemmatimonadota bacterium]NIT67860.1 beta-lactamase family protein [Gemmatimonadota bacterium]NIU53839.1 serine hydrolase [Gemmatimonadota bacterium]